MRNHLAEDVLNEDFLYLMEAFQSDLNDGSHLNSSIQLLTHLKNKLCFVIHSRWHPCQTVGSKFYRMHLTSSRIGKKEIAQLKTRGVNTVKKLISPKCLEDIENMLLTFKEMCVIHLNRFPRGYVVPSRINSDIVENHFCQQHGLYNGSTTNPTYLNYCSTVNSTVVKIWRKKIQCWTSSRILVLHGMCTADTLSSSKKI